MPITNNDNDNRGLSPIQDSPTGLPTQQPQTGAPLPHNSERSSDYYEDVDPKFAEPAHINHPQSIPLSLIPGNRQPQNQNVGFLSAPNRPQFNTSDSNLPRSSSYDDLPEASGSRSPAISEASHFTSVSQRPVNPAWRPDMGAAAGQFGPYGGGRGRPMRQEDVIFEANAANPDFAIPGTGRGRGRGRGRGGRGGRGGMMQGPPATMTGPGTGMGTQGRYPGASAI